MKILHVLPSISPLKGGPSQAVKGMVKALNELGVEAEIATTNDDGKNYLDVPLNKKIDYQGVPVRFFSRHPLPMKEFIFSYDISQWLRQHIQNYDLIHTHFLFSYAPTYAGAMARHYNIPYVVRTIGQLTPWALAQSKWKKRLYSLLLERRNLSKAAAIHCTSVEEAYNVRNFGIKTPTFNIPLGVKTPLLGSDSQEKLRYTYNIPANVPIILFLSRIHPKKRLELLLEASRSLKQENKQFHLIVAGSGESSYVSQIKNLVKLYKLDDCVTFAGFVTGYSKELLLSGSNVFVLPSHSENFGISVAEAVAAGLAVVITKDVQIAPELLKAEAGLIIEGNAKSCKNALDKLITSSALRDHLGRNGIHLATDRYSWSTIGKKLVETYTKIIETNKLAKKH